MRILLDECVPRPLRRALTGHHVRTVREMGWAGKRNGELLRLLAAQGFEVLLTVDQNLRHQQNVSAANVAILVLIGPGTKLTDLLPLMPSALAALGTIRPGDVVEVTSPPPASPP